MSSTSRLRSRATPLVPALLALLAALALPACTASRPVPSPPPAPAATRDGRWQQDIAYLAQELPRLHPDAFFAIPRESLEAAAAQLSALVPRLADHEIVVGLFRLAALLGDEHTRVQWPPGEGGAVPAFGSYPLALRCFDDGIHATTTTAHGAVALRGRLLAIGGVPVDEAIARAAPLTAHSNAWALQDQLPLLLTTPEVVHALGLSASLESADYLFARAEPPPDDGPPPGLKDSDAGSDDAGERAGEEEGGDVGAPPDAAPSPTVELPLAAVRAGNRYDWRRAPEAPPVSEQHLDRAYWMTPLAGGAVVYAQVNACREDPQAPFAGFAREVLAALEAPRAAGGPARLVLDLRHNGGGDTAVLEPLLDGLRARRRAGAAPPVALIGRGTYSSAMMIAWVLRDELGARLVGEPTGGTPDGWGEVIALRLPNSGLRVTCSSKRFELEPGADSLQPDLRVPSLSSDWFAGRDAALEAALAGAP